MKKVRIIAEAGVNHNGRKDLAFELIDAASKAGADIVKFQTWKTKSIISKYTPKAEYQINATGSNESMLEMVENLELPFETFKILKDYCDKVGIGFLSTPFDIESARFLISIGMNIVKIPSGEITNLPLLEVIAGLPCSVILSTGMCEMKEVEDAIHILQRKSKKDITILHCNTQYPTPMCDVNLLAMRTLKDQFGMPVGLSDHSLGIEVPIAAAALGAEIIEKHFTLSRMLEGPDHKASLEPDEFYRMVRSIRAVESALGDGNKRVTDSERMNRDLVRKSIVTSRKISKGETFTEENIAVKRPGTGISPMKWYDVLGKTAKQNFEEDELVTLD